jgi:hypothetical protein
MNPNDIQIMLAYSSWIKDKPIITAKHIPSGLEYTATGRSAHGARALALEGLQQLYNESKPTMNTTMNVEEFFSLPQAQQEEIARLVLKRRKICQEAQDIKTHRDRLNQQERELQELCTHPAVKKTHRRHEQYDSHTNFSTDFYCPDCDKRWTAEGSL